jgi:hypothetical protein
MLEDCFEYYKGCQDCQKFGNIQRVPASALNPIIKPWPFRGWGIDLIGQINPPSSKEQEFVRIQLEDKFPNAFKTVKIHMHKLKKSSQDKYKR